MLEIQKMTKRQWFIMGIAIVLDIVLVILGLYFSSIIATIFVPNMVISILFDCCVVVIMIVLTLVMVRIANKKQ